MVNQKNRARARGMHSKVWRRSDSGGDGLDACGCGAREFAEADEAVGEGEVGVHGGVANDVVEDVGLGEVVERGGVADGDGGGEGALAATVEEDVGGR